MSSFQEILSRVETLKGLTDKYESKKRDRIAPLQRKQDELERELRRVKQIRETASKELEQGFTVKIQAELTLLSSAFPHSQSTEIPTFPTSFCHGETDPLPSDGRLDEDGESGTERAENNRPEHEANQVPVSQGLPRKRQRTANSDVQGIPKQKRQRVVRTANFSSPIPGELYQVCWHGGSRSRSVIPYVGMCLPIDNFEKVGITGSIYDTGLIRSIPRCYRTHPRTNGILGWNKYYQNGGPKTGQRKFPFLFFTSDLHVTSEGNMAIPKNKNLLSDISPFGFNDSNSHLPGYANALGFKSRMPNHHRDVDSESGRSVSQQDCEGFADAGDSRADFGAKTPVKGVPEISAYDDLASQSAECIEQPAVDASESEPVPICSMTDDPACVALAVLETFRQISSSRTSNNSADSIEDGASIIEIPSMGQNVHAEHDAVDYPQSSSKLGSLDSENNPVQEMAGQECGLPMESRKGHLQYILATNLDGTR
ncbi:uncharacterized protein PpBr36_10399 [Pyricularia pennisetigena]|uniref:uncharacterized protein n=1 Tax=Pyricularia pennisetigena TaxID=1578925 RepID=UPI001154C2F8|nr:uncharacterized protein PpBr36_10399 [Pyricularia pennisetigena]TLS21322.1 hypothetical protein PpBr36_10399 [Pyricularia pennisetigena]